MTRTVILYHSSHVTLSLCDFEILEFFSWKLVSGRYAKIVSVLLNSHKVTKNVFYATFKVDLLANWQNTVWNMVQRHCVTFGKSFRVFSFLEYCLKQSHQLPFIFVTNPGEKKGLFKNFHLRVPINMISNI